MQDTEIKTDASPPVSKLGFIGDLKEKYGKLENVICPYLGQEVRFTSTGFKHLIWKVEKGMRPKSVIMDRFDAIDRVCEVLSKSGTLQEYENNGKEFLGFIAIVGGNKYKVVVTKTGDGGYKFVSVIPKWKTGKRDTFENK